MKNLRGYLLASAAFACFGVAAQPAHAQFAYGGGATFPSVVYRGMMDCLFNQVQGSPGQPGPQAIITGCSSFNTTGFGGEILYAPVGSGNGKAMLKANSATGSSAPPSASNTVPWTEQSLGVTSLATYDGFEFAGSDDVINAGDVAAWNTAGNPAKYGNMVQIPALVGPVGIGFNGTDGTGAPLNILNSTPSGGSSGLNLSRHALCGIFSGHITLWQNTALTATNGPSPGTALGSGNITVVHRSDGSGTTFLLSNALATQCQFEFGPNNETDSTTVSWAFPWTDKASSACPFPVAHGANQLNWPDTLATGNKDQCGNVVAPGVGHFTQASGSGGVEALVASTPAGNGSIGYASPDFWAPVKVGAPKTANLQSQWDITASTGAFQPPTAQGAQVAMSSATPIFTPATIGNPLAWSLQGVVPNPSIPGAYPIAGFTWIEMYQCYQRKPSGVNSLTWVFIFLDFLYGAAQAQTILNSQGFNQLPFPWLEQVNTLLNDGTLGPNFIDLHTGGCTGKVGAL